MHMKNKDFKYVLLPAKVHAGEVFEDLHNKIFDFWESVWGETFSKSGHPAEHWKDDFLRQDVIAAILYKDQVVGCHLYSFFDLHSHASTRAGYLSHYPEEAIQYLEKGSFKNLMGMEYLCVAKDFRHFSDKFTFGEILSALGFFVAKTHNADCVIGTPIKGTSVKRMSEMFGATCLNTPIEKYGYELSIIVIPMAEAKPHSDPGARKLVQQLWNEHISYLPEDVWKKVA